MGKGNVYTESSDKYTNHQLRGVCSVFEIMEIYSDLIIVFDLKHNIPAYISPNFFSQMLEVGQIVKLNIIEFDDNKYISDIVE